MLKTLLSAVLVLVLAAPLHSALAMEPEEAVAGIYAGQPWETLPPGGHGWWDPLAAVAWSQGNSSRGLQFLTGSIDGKVTVSTVTLEPGDYEAQVRAVVSGSGEVHTITFLMIGDDDEDDRWRVFDIVDESGKRLSDVLAKP